MLWKRVISGKYEGEELKMCGWLKKWLHLMDLFVSIRGMCDEVKSNTKISVIDGSKTRFWKNEWHEKGNLEVLLLTYTTQYSSGTIKYHSRVMDKSGLEL